MALRISSSDARRPRPAARASLGTRRAVAGRRMVPPRTSRHSCQVLRCPRTLGRPTRSGRRRRLHSALFVRRRRRRRLHPTLVRRRRRRRLHPALFVRRRRCLHPALVRRRRRRRQHPALLGVGGHRACGRRRRFHAPVLGPRACACRHGLPRTWLHRTVPWMHRCGGLTSHPARLGSGTVLHAGVLVDASRRCGDRAFHGAAATSSATWLARAARTGIRRYRVRGLVLRCLVIRATRRDPNQIRDARERFRRFHVEDFHLAWVTRVACVDERNVRPAARWPSTPPPPAAGEAQRP